MRSRWHSIDESAADLRTDLKRVKRDADSGRSVAPAEETTPQQRERSWSKLAAAALVSILAVVAGWQAWSRLGPPPPETERSIAVLPLATLGGDEDDEYFSTGLT